MKKDKIISNLKQTLKTIKGFNSNTPTKAELNYKVVGQVIEEFAEALLFLLDVDVADEAVEQPIFNLLPSKDNESGS